MLIWLSWRIRSFFCSHEFEISQSWVEYEDGKYYRKGIVVSAVCKKCSFERKFWKHLMHGR